MAFASDEYQFIIIIIIFLLGVDITWPPCDPVMVSSVCYCIFFFCYATNSISWMQAFAVIANSPLRIDLSCVLEQVVSELTAFLRKV